MEKQVHGLLLQKYLCLTYKNLIVKNWQAWAIIAIIKTNDDKL